jgi:hypothetical protein
VGRDPTRAVGRDRIVAEVFHDGAVFAAGNPETRVGIAVEVESYPGYLHLGSTEDGFSSNRNRDPSQILRIQRALFLQVVDAQLAVTRIRHVGSRR